MGLIHFCRAREFSLLHSVRTISAAHTVSYPMGTAGRLEGVKLTIHPYAVTLLLKRDMNSVMTWIFLGSEAPRLWDNYNIASANFYLQKILESGPRAVTYSCKSFIESSMRLNMNCGIVYRIVLYVWKPSD
jgi:hypothetical protein